MTPLDELNLRHLRAFVEVCRRGSISAASGVVHLSQPAVTHAIRNLESQLRVKLFSRSGRGMAPTDLGVRFRIRVERALDRLNAGTPKSHAGRVEARATMVQFRTLDTIARTRSFSAAARALGVAQPSAHRAARDLEGGLGLTLFDKTPSGINLTRPGLSLHRAAQLMRAELDQALQEVAAASGQGQAGIRIGALPLVRATILAPAIEEVQSIRRPLRVSVDDGPFPDLLQAVRSGDLDLLVGALRSPPPAEDVVQEALFTDRLGVFCGPGHPILKTPDQAAIRLADFPWVLPRPETPTRAYFEQAFPAVAQAASGTLVETSSMILVRDLLQPGTRLTLISRAQVASEIRQGLLFEMPIELDDPPRPIGMLHRADWFPTAEQEAFLQALRSVAGALPA